MSHNQELSPGEVTTLGNQYTRALASALVVAVLGLVTVLAVFVLADPEPVRFFGAYLTGFAFWLSVALGSLFFVLLQHLTRAGWSVTVRRLSELNAATLPVLALAFVPVAIGLVSYDLYPWVHGAEGLSASKQVWLSPTFFLVRFGVYFAIWCGMSFWLWRHSVRLDSNHDAERVLAVQARSAPAMVVLALTFAAGAFDLLMTLEPHWYSTMFGVYYFAGAAVSAVAIVIVMAVLAQSRGRLTTAINLDHYQDLGKLLFGFVFFWGYIAFSQYMLIWYANIPEETTYLIERGASTAAAHESPYTAATLLLLVGHFAIPFAGLLSRWVKRRTWLLLFWAVWVLFMHLVDMFWIVRPALQINHARVPVSAVDLVLTLGCAALLGGITFAVMTRLSRDRHLLPLHDPRLSDALAFEQTS